MYYRFLSIGAEGGVEGEKKKKQEDISLLADPKPIIGGIPPAREKGKKREPHLSKKKNLLRTSAK